MTIRSERFLRFNEEKIPVVVAEIDVDSENELPSVAGIEGRILNQGSTALIITEGKLAILAANGRWYIDGKVVSL